METENLVMTVWLSIGLVHGWKMVRDMRAYPRHVKDWTDWLLVLNPVTLVGWPLLIPLWTAEKEGDTPPK
jgi:hypothetical protein